MFLLSLAVVLVTTLAVYLVLGALGLDGVVRPLLAIVVGTLVTGPVTRAFS